MSIRVSYSKVFGYALSAHVQPGRQDKLRASGLLGCVYGLTVAACLVALRHSFAIPVSVVEVLLATWAVMAISTGTIYGLFRSEEQMTTPAGVMKFSEVPIGAAGLFAISILAVDTAVTIVALLLRAG